MKISKKRLNSIILEAVREALGVEGCSDKEPLEEYEQEVYYKNINGVEHRCVADDEGNEDCYPVSGGGSRYDSYDYEDVPKDYGMYDDEMYEHIRRTVREVLTKK